MSLTKRDHCLTLVFLGASGLGKSITARMVSPSCAEAENYLTRVDDFTPKSFVSHAARVAKKELEKIDLLPRIENKVMVTKELAPLFSGDDESLKKNFATLTSVLDGNGYVTSSGVHGTRGYSGKYIFNWIGATTPIPDRTYKVMSQLGNRILFYYIDSQAQSEDELVSFAETYKENDTVTQLQSGVNEFILDYFQRFPPDSVDPSEIVIAQTQTRQIVRLAKLISEGRVQIDFDQFGEPEPGLPEGPQRLILLLQTLARGLALSSGRFSVEEADMGVLRHIAFSTLPQRRMGLLLALVRAGGHVTIREVESFQRTSAPTAKRRMQELGATPIADFISGDDRASSPATLSLNQDWKWLLTP